MKLRFDNLHITVERVTYGIFDGPVSLHRHGKTFYEAHLICGGRGTLIIDSKDRYPLEKGSLYMTGPDIVHEQLTDSAMMMEEYCLGFEVNRPKGSTDSEASAALLSNRFWIGTDGGECEALFEKLSLESRERKIGFQNNVKNLISSILVVLVRDCTGHAPSAEMSRSTLDDKRNIIIDVCFLQDYATITLEELSGLLGLSSRQTQRFLKKQYGKTFSEMKRESQKNKATELIRNGKSLEEAAAAVGYSDMQSFRRLLSKAKSDSYQSDV
ncbi:MAG: helix-turn-helix domain-containing protein [Firmicutes bacterium]|nr:helix-turn-helix domain-containing protein [Bacillota bacterium]